MASKKKSAKSTKQNVTEESTINSWSSSKNVQQKVQQKNAHVFPNVEIVSNVVTASGNVQQQGDAHILPNVEIVSNVVTASGNVQQQGDADILPNVEVVSNVVKASRNVQQQVPYAKKTVADTEVIAYVHKLSLVKRNRRNTMDYSTLVLQTENDTVEALLYSKNKRPLLVDSANSHTPLKIQRFTKSSDGKKLIINDMTRVGHAKQGEYSFQYVKLDSKVSSIKEILENANDWDNVSLRGKAIHIGEVAEVGAKRLKLAQATFSDLTGSITVDIWEEQVPLIECGKLYLLEDLHVRIWAGVKKVSTRVDTVITPIVDEELQKVAIRHDDIQTDNHKTITVPNIAFVQKVETSIACTGCSRRVLQSTSAKFVHCDRCGSTLRIADCELQVCANVVVNPSEGEVLNLTIFHSTLKTVVSGDLAKLGDEKVAEALLEFGDLKIKYNTKTFVITELEQC